MSELTIVDLFAGCGGLSTGAAESCERDFGLTPGEDVELHAINHWEPAVETHRTNHPWANHYQSRIEQLYPPDVVEPDTVDLLMGGPSCTHFSNARGGKPVKDQKRAPAWQVLDWVEKLRPAHVLIENVEEFRNWSKIVDGEPTNDGEIFQRWCGMLEALGYSVLYDDAADTYGRVLNAADYGDPQSRNRLFILASRKELPTVPEPTHCDDPEDPRPPRQTAADIIDWSNLGTSLWTRDLTESGVTPLAENTMARIAEGIRRHCHDRFEPFADALATIGPDRLRALRERIVPAQYAEAVAGAVDEPFLVHLPAADSGVQLATPEAFCLRQQSGGTPVPSDAPLSTVSTKAAIGLTTVGGCPLVQPKNGKCRGNDSNLPYRANERPLNTVTTDPRAKLVEPYLCPLYSSRAGQRPRTRAVDRPLMTVPANKGAPANLATPEPFLVKYYGQSTTTPVDEPLGTITKKDRFALCVPEAWPWGLDVRYRMLEPAELKQAQGFPPGYGICGRTKATVKKQIGNAVPVNLARSLVRHLLETGQPSLSTFDGGIRPDPEAEVPDYQEVASDD